MKQGIALCDDNAKRLLESADALVDVNPAHAFGLYTLAVEEHGKAIWLGELVKSVKPQEEVQDEVQKVFTKHEEKIQKACESPLPQTCTRISYGVRLTHNLEASGTQIWYRQKVDPLGFKRATKSVCAPAYTTGTLADITDEDYLVDFGARLEAFFVDCFYIGQGKDEIQWSPEISPDEEQLRRAIADFRNHISKQQNQV